MRRNRERTVVTRNETVGRSDQAYPSDLAPEIQVALAALADVEMRYDLEREALERTGSKVEQEHLRLQLEERHHAERGPLVQRLAELQQTMAFALMRRSWAAAPRERTSPCVEVEVERACDGWPSASRWSA